MSVFSLDESDFNVKEGPKGSTLNTGISGSSLVLFYSTKCQHCQQLIPIFKKLPAAVGGCTFAMVNVSQNKGIINKSQATKIPIKYVPLILLHIDGKPFMRYDGPHKFQELKRFVIEIAQKVSKNIKQQSNIQGGNAKKSGPVIPGYTIGLPKNSGPRDAVGYNNFDLAYGTPAK